LTAAFLDDTFNADLDHELSEYAACLQQSDLHSNNVIEVVHFINNIDWTAWWNL